RSRATSPRTARSWRAASRSGSRASSTRRMTASRTAGRRRDARRKCARTDMEGLVAQGLEKWFKSRKVVDSVSLDIQRGEVVGLLGPNGAGKTTSFYMMVGLLQADGGRIFLEGQEITKLPMYQRCRMGVGYLPQESSVFRKLTVEENLLAILETLDLTRDERRERAHDLLAELDPTPPAPTPHPTPAREHPPRALRETLELPRDERRERAHDLLAELDLTPLARHPAYTLSGG